MPGGLVRGFVTDREGHPLSGYSRITDEVPFEKRFGGWYVTGTHGRLTHRGNIIDSKAGPAEILLPSPNNVQDLSHVLETGKYLTMHSDLVAQMLLHHQVQGQNLIIRVGHEARLKKRSDAEELLVRHLLFADEVPLAEPVQGSTGFARWFQKRGRVEAKGRSLREWDLKTRLFKYRLSDLIDTPLFDGLPDPVKQRIYGKLWRILSAKSPPPPFDQMPADERKAIMEMLRHFKDDLPPEWGTPLVPSPLGERARVDHLSGGARTKSYRRPSFIAPPHPAFGHRAPPGGWSPQGEGTFLCCLVVAMPR